MERLDRCKSMERRKPYSQTLSVENESTHKNHKTSLRLRKCNSSVGSAATFPSRARSKAILPSVVGSSRCEMKKSMVLF